MDSCGKLFLYTQLVATLIGPIFSSFHSGLGFAILFVSCSDIIFFLYSCYIPVANLNKAGTNNRLLDLLPDTFRCDSSGACNRVNIRIEAHV